MTVDGLEIIVNPKVFPPKLDSIMLAQKMGVNPGDIVLDLCAGSGIQAVFAAKVKRAAQVYSCDISPYAIENIKLNARRHHVDDRVEIFLTDLFPDEKVMADVIVANPPYVDHQPRNMTEGSIWDAGHQTFERLLTEAPTYLKPNGRMYLSWANFADFNFFEKSLKSHGYQYQVTASGHDAKDPRIEFRVYEISKR